MGAGVKNFVLLTKMAWGKTYFLKNPRQIDPHIESQSQKL